LDNNHQLASPWSPKSLVSGRLGFQEAGSVMEETALAIPFILRANINTTIAELMAPRHHST
jgi:hypothetical protein